MSLIYTNSRSKVKPKLKSKAERDEYAAWCAKYGIDPTGKTRAKKSNRVVTLPGVVTKPAARENEKIPSLNEWVTGAVSTRKTMTYTGNKMVGIAAMHKSNLVPIFNEDAAKDVSSMRR